MNHKVLLADDSLTIQKVIKITLAQQPYDITDCSSEEELFRKLPEVEPKLVFLDFNLSEKYTGYELTAKIKSIVPNAKVLLLLGTFDSVDDAAMEKSGASDKIVKPFDSNKFISVCRQLIDSFVTDEDLEYPEPIQAEEKVIPIISNPEDQWTVNNAAQMDIPAPIEDKPLDDSFPQINALEQGLSEWSMSIPGVINEPAVSSDKMIDLPPVIGAKTAAKPEATRDDIKFPASTDLDYPDMDAGGFELEAAHELPTSVPAQADKKPKYVSLEELSPIELDANANDSTGKFEMQAMFEADESDAKNIESQIQDEVAEDLWQVDEFETLKREVSSKIEEMQSELRPTRDEMDDSLFGGEDRDTIKWNDTASAFSVNQQAIQRPVVTDDLRSEMEAMVKKYVQEYMDQMFKSNVEKVSWEVIPDLAENLIRQELHKISDRILNEK